MLRSQGSVWWVWPRMACRRNVVDCVRASVVVMVGVVGATDMEKRGLPLRSTSTTTTTEAGATAATARGITPQFGPWQNPLTALWAANITSSGMLHQTAIDPPSQHWEL